MPSFSPFRSLATVTSLSALTLESTAGLRGCATTARHVPRSAGLQACRAGRSNDMPDGRPRLLLVVARQRPDPHVPEAHRVAVILEPQRPFGVRREVLPDLLVLGGSPEWRRVVDDEVVVEDGRRGRLLER